VITMTRRMLACAALLLAAGCAVTPGMRPNHVRPVNPAPAQPFSSIVLVMMPVGRPAGGEMRVVYDATWRDPETWRQGFYRRLEKNFAHNGLSLTIFDAAVPGRVKIEPTQLQVRVTAETIMLEKTWMRFSVRYDASVRDTRHASFIDTLQLQRWPEREADRQTYLILNALWDTGLVAPPADGKAFALAPG
jgi:hypothetical protein